MKILSKFHDYYDKACQWGIDTTQLFLRNTTSIDCYQRFGYGELYTRGICASSGAIWFCGKMYPYICVRHHYGVPTKDEYFFDTASLKVYVEKTFPDVIWDTGRKFRSGLSSEVKAVFDDTSGYKGEVFLAKLAQEHKCPYLHITGGCGYRHPDEVELYPMLQDFHFQKVKDPYTAFQDIQSYKFGVLGCNENEVVTISDKDRIAGKGFDTKYGFRTRPHKEK